ncbi:MAG: RDD family protein [Nitrospirae bacterium]|nr:RDD family protein [Nitrospirota bacterium]
MNNSSSLSKANILNRIIAKTLDFIIVGTLFEIIPKMGYFAGMVYLLICDGLFEGRSVGKRIIGLKVILHETTQACTFRESVMRNLPLAIGYILIVVPFIGFLFSIIILLFESLLMIGSEKGMRLGDEIAKTQVIDEVKS